MILSVASKQNDSMIPHFHMFKLSQVIRRSVSSKTIIGVYDIQDTKSELSHVILEYESKNSQSVLLALDEQRPMYYVCFMLLFFFLCH